MDRLDQRIKEKAQKAKSLLQRAKETVKEDIAAYRRRDPAATSDIDIELKI